jgi:hypothetical protein
MSDPQTSTRSRTALALAFPALVGLSAFLLFQVQLVLGKALLPRFGGTSALWTTCLLFFQCALVAGYAWSHGLVERCRPARQRDLHLLLAAAALLLVAWHARSWPSPVTPPPAVRTPLGSPVQDALALLAAAVGLPFVALAATSPLLQAWYARLVPGASPFRLYALSNAGSLLGLLSYPLVVEPRLSLGAQGGAWALAFAACMLGVAACAALAGRERDGAERAPDRAVGPAPSPSPATRLLWLALAAFPSLLLSAVSGHLTQEVAAVPLLWMLPLAVYLLTLIACFARPALGDRALWGPGLALAALVAVLGLEWALVLDVRARVVLWSLVLLSYGMAGHGELVRLRPHPSHLTAYYLAVAVGGALGGFTVAVLAPLAFDGYWELHAGLLLGPVVVAAAWLRDPGSPLRSEDRPLATRARVFAAGTLVALAAWLAADVRATRRGAFLSRRGFYGVVRVVREHPGGADEQLKLLHGRTAHGLQLADPARRLQPTSYFGPSSGAGLAISRHPRRKAGQPLRVGVIGLGVGTLAAWSEPGDRFRFYELDPEVVALSQGESPVFTYLRDARGETSVAVGDGRLLLEAESPQQLDVLVLDAFSSDAIPAHLLSRQAFSSYLRHLREGGVIAAQVTNRYVDLKPVLRGAAAALGLHAAHLPAHEAPGVLWSSEWMLLARDRGLLDDDAVSAATLPPLAGALPPVLWTDDWSDLLGVLKR